MNAKILFCLKRLPSMTRDEFQAYWRDVHAPMVAQRAKLLGIQRYVQSHTLDDASFASISNSRGGHPAFDGVAEIWFSEPTRGTPQERRRANQELLEDERRFIDLSSSPIFLARDSAVVDDMVAHSRVVQVTASPPAGSRSS